MVQINFCRVPDLTPALIDGRLTELHDTILRFRYAQNNPGAGLAVLRCSTELATNRVADPLGCRPCLRNTGTSIIAAERQRDVLVNLNSHGAMENLKRANLR
jgi:hypothetical protein